MVKSSPGEAVLVPELASKLKEFFCRFSSEPYVVPHPMAFRCLKNEPDLERVMTGDFSPLGSLDCLLPRDLIFRWAWSSIRLAVGPPIGALYNDAVVFMNLGAQNEGKLVCLRFLLLNFKF